LYARANERKNIVKLEELKTHIKVLAGLTETEAPVISCYLDLTAKNPSYRQALELRTTLLHANLKKEALDAVKQFLDHDLVDGMSGAAIFARGGKKQFFLPLQFQVSLPTWISVDTVPSIYHLVEMKDTYHRYVVLLSTRNSARIYEVNLGEVTRRLWVQHPELRKRVGREWTRLHYQNHRHERGRQFIKEKIEVLDRLMSEGGYGHLILAGDQRRIAEVRNLLPKRLMSKLFDAVSVSGKAEIDDVVATTLSAFIAEEERESGAMVETLLNAFYKHELAAFGPDICLQTLLRKQADVLVIAKECNAGLARYCETCGWAATGDPLPDVCAECGATSLRECKAREELVRLAELSGCQIEFVGKSHAHALDSFEGVGCLLRYAFPVMEGLKT